MDLTKCDEGKVRIYVTDAEGVTYIWDLVDFPHLIQRTPRTLTQASPDSIAHPSHYTSTAIEPIDVIEAWGLGFNLGNVLKYLCRVGRKGDTLEQLQKAHWYIEREIANRRQLPEG